MPSACCRLGILAEFGHDATRPARNFPIGVGLVDKLLRGAKPAEIRVEQASTYQLVINLNAARHLDLSIPAAILIGADEVID
jgi:putative tryptophan/tyrosine transport system substrate-binding protein